MSIPHHHPHPVARCDTLSAPLPAVSFARLPAYRGPWHGVVVVVVVADRESPRQHTQEREKTFSRRPIGEMTRRERDGAVITDTVQARWEAGVESESVHIHSFVSGCPALECILAIEKQR